MRSVLQAEKSMHLLVWSISQNHFSRKLQIQTSQTSQTKGPMKNDELLKWLQVKLADAQKALAAREQGEATWKEGSEKAWKAVGCRKTKAERFALGEIEGRIAVKCRHEIEMFQAVIKIADARQSESWIPVSQKLPEDGEEVICCYVGVYGPRIVKVWTDTTRTHFGLPSSRHGSQPATHWMPINLPQPPIEKGEG